MVPAVVLRATIAFLCCALVLGACSTGDDNTDASPTTPARTATTATTAAGAPAPLQWKSCEKIECATLEVPADYSNPSGPKLHLALARRRADGDRIGSLLINPGGPGVAGTPYVENASSLLSRTLLDRFDVVSWDPRGTGKSTSIRCVDSLDFFFDGDMSPDNQTEIDANVAASRKLADGCGAHSGDLLPYLSSSATVDDMESIRTALGDDELTYFGFSYGTLLGALYADRYPQRVRAIVLDGAIDPSLGFEDTVRDQSVGFDSALNAFFQHCRADGCGFGGSDPRRAYDALMAQIDAEPLPAEVHGEDRSLGPTEADLGVGNLLYFGTQGWDALSAALQDAARGDGSALLEQSDDYTLREPGGKYGNGQEAFYGISCLDAPFPTIDQFPAIAARVGAAAPEFGPVNVWLSAPCALWPVPAEGQPAALHAAGAPPIVVLGTTNDPATPLKWARALSSQLDSAHLVVYRGEGHTAYARGDKCVDSAVDRYLVDLVPPADGLVC
jgi:pimeloyl-ACP methyl ester carboxylesterase